MNVEWLEIFREVAARGSLTAAAQSLGYTQPTVSRQLSALEDELGARLFDRLPRGVRLTEEGRALLGHTGAVLDRLDDARAALDDLRTLEAGRLRIGAFDSADATLVPRALAAFRTAHPRVSLSLTEGASTAQLDRLCADELDVAVVGIYPDRILDTSQFELDHLLDDVLMVALPAGHRLAGRRTVRLADLADESWIEGFPGTVGVLTEACRRAGFRPRIDFGVREWSAKQGFVAAGLGLTLVPLIAADAARPDIELVKLRAGEAPARKVYAATVRGVARSPAVTAFVRFLGEAARS